MWYLHSTQRVNLTWPYHSTCFGNIMFHETCKRFLCTLCSKSVIFLSSNFMSGYWFYSYLHFSRYGEPRQCWYQKSLDDSRIIWYIQQHIHFGERTSSPISTLSALWKYCRNCDKDQRQFRHFVSWNSIYLVENKQQRTPNN